MEVIVDNIEPKRELTPQEYFNEVKDKRNQITDEELDRIYSNCLRLLNKYVITGQKKGAAKLCFHLECIEKERDIVAMGINTFVYRDDIEYYIDRVASDVVKIIELENYDREIPDEIVNVIKMVKDKFDQLYVVFTDYTGKTEREVEKERRAKDPILFGTFQNPKNNTVIDRFYYLGDWADEFCDLTLDKMVNDTRNHSGNEIEHIIKTPKDIEELKKQLENISEVNGAFRVQEAKKKGFFTKVRTFLRF